MPRGPRVNLPVLTCEACGHDTCHDCTRGRCPECKPARRATPRSASPLVRNGISRARVFASLVAMAEACTPEEWSAGRSWYPAARAIAAELSATSGRDLLTCSAVLAHFSPSTPWARNITLARAFVADPEQVGPGRRYGTLGESTRQARAAWFGADPLASFGPDAHKIRSFARNIAGDMHAVTLDVWMARCLGVPQARFGNVGLYDALADIVRDVAAMFDCSPATLQAVLWTHVRGAAD